MSPSATPPRPGLSPLAGSPTSSGAPSTSPLRTRRSSAPRPATHPRRSSCGHPPSGQRHAPPQKPLRLLPTSNRFALLSPCSPRSVPRTPSSPRRSAASPARQGASGRAPPSAAASSTGRAPTATPSARRPPRPSSGPTPSRRAPRWERTGTPSPASRRAGHCRHNALPQPHRTQRSSLAAPAEEQFQEDERCALRLLHLWAPALRAGDWQRRARGGQRGASDRRQLWGRRHGPPARPGPRWVPGADCAPFIRPAPAQGSFQPLSSAE